METGAGTGEVSQCATRPYTDRSLDTGIVGGHSNHLVHVARSADAVFNIAGQPIRISLRFHKITTPVAVRLGEFSHIPSMESARIRRRSQRKPVIGIFHNTQAHDRRLVVTVAGLDVVVIDDGVVAHHQERVHVPIVAGGVDERDLGQGLKATVHHREGKGKRTVGGVHHGDGRAPEVPVIVGEQKLTMNGVTGLVKQVLDMERGIAVIASGGDEQDTQVGEAADFIGHHARAIHIVHIIDAPAHADDKPLTLLLGHIVHPAPGIDHVMRVFQVEGAEEQISLVRHTPVFGAGTAASGNGGAVRAVVAIAVGVEGVTVGGKQRLGPDVFCAIVIPVRRRTTGLELVPRTQHTIADHVGVVKDRMSVVEAPVRDTDDHPISVEALRETIAAPYTVHTTVNDGAVQPNLAVKLDADQPQKSDK